MTEPAENLVDDIRVAPVPDTEPPGLGDLDPTDTYAEGGDVA